MTEPPVAPREPEPDECCGSGCEICVWDRYEQALQRYRERLQEWQASLKEHTAPR